MREEALDSLLFYIKKYLIYASNEKYGKLYMEIIREHKEILSLIDEIEDKDKS